VLDLLPGGRIAERCPAAQTLEDRGAVAWAPGGAPELRGRPEPLVPVVVVVVGAAAVLVTRGGLEAAGRHDGGMLLEPAPGRLRRSQQAPGIRGIRGFEEPGRLGRGRG